MRSTRAPTSSPLVLLRALSLALALVIVQAAGEPPPSPSSHSLPLLSPSGVPVGSVLLTVGLIFLSGAFSGLTLGLLSLSLESLELIMSSGSAREAQYASQIYPMRRRGNLLLCTLLLGNTLTNVLIATSSASFLGGAAGTIVATLLIVLFGEILPQVGRERMLVCSVCCCHRTAV